MEGLPVSPFAIGRYAPGKLAPGLTAPTEHYVRRRVSGGRKFGLIELGIVIAITGILFTVYVRWTEPEWAKGIFTSIPKSVFFPTAALLLFYFSFHNFRRLRNGLDSNTFDRMMASFELVMCLVMGIISLVISFVEF